jgi:hypothetical protein
MPFDTRRTPAQQFSKNLTHIRFIHLIANDLDAIETRRKENKKSYLFQSYIINLVALWQTFLEDLAKESFEKMIVVEPNASFHEVLQRNFKQLLKRFNTPKTQNIDELIEGATGIKNISNNWHWDGMSNENAKQLLDEILSIRHEIAHKGYSKKSLSVKGNYEYMKFLLELADILNAVVDNYTSAELKKRGLE